MGRVEKNHFHLLGISHKTAPIEIREKVSFDADQYVDMLDGLIAIDGIEECVLLSTCNRTEIYTVVSDDFHEPAETVASFIIEKTSAPAELNEHLYHYQGAAVIEHIFRVAAGLDSMILGEPQIFGQVKAAYSVANDASTTGSAFNRLFHHTFKVGKQIRSMTAIGEGVVSISLAAVEKAKQIFGDLSDKSVLLIGAGKTGELSAKRLSESGVKHLKIANRTMERAEKLAEQLGGCTVPFENILQSAATSDIVISSVTAREPILKRAGFEEFLSGRDGAALLLIDLGVPRNIDHEIAALESVTLLNIDDLEGLTLDNLDKRKDEAEKAEEIILFEVEEFETWLSEREMIPVIRGLHDSCETIRADELDKMKNRVDKETFDMLDLISRRIVRKILHNPIVIMREKGVGKQRERLINSVRELFMECVDESVVEE